ncbi:DUF5919 domain-containing protein [Nocardia camponoti]|uniref:DUF5919 domain-containing protein n=1 Tax=Nocardia camponoti TaxID=1616106 RepID=A0A917QCH6_9NOCA|nr:DUF5919 domain-containing protein [Nocardia camponoti]GGK43346.1 hypothetical protein GCM10011591_13750 [Nocardia camponoti]
MTALKELLRQRHWQTHSAFSREYNAVARRVEPDLVGAGPGKAQFYKWLSGDLAGLPLPHHCRVLEAMFPGHPVRTLFSADSSPAPSAARYLTTTYPTRNHFLRDYPPTELFAGARRIDLLGIALNVFCQQVSDGQITALLESGTEIRCLFLDPTSRHTDEREAEEGQVRGTLTSLIAINRAMMQRIARKTRSAAGTLTTRTYCAPPRLNIIRVDELCAFQPYLPQARGLDCPTFVATGSELREAMATTFESLWRGAGLSNPRES